MSGGGAMLRAEGLRFRYPGSDDFTLDVPELELGGGPGSNSERNTGSDAEEIDAKTGGLTVITGRNGSGKTTLARLLCGLLGPDRGRILFNGMETGELSIAEFSRHSAYVYQNPELMFFTESVADEVAFHPRNTGLPSDGIRDRVDELCRTFDLERLRERHPFMLSRGEQQRLAAACVMAMGSPFIFFDEATKGMDNGSRQTFLDMLERVEGLHPVLISNEAAVFDRATRLIVLRDGKVVADGGPGMMYERDFQERTGLEPPEGRRMADTLDMEFSPDIAIFSERVWENLHGDCVPEIASKALPTDSIPGSTPDSAGNLTVVEEPDGERHSKGNLDPRTRFALVIMLSTTALFAPTLATTLAVLAAAAMMLAVSGSGWTEIRRFTRGIPNMLLFLFMVQAIFVPGPRLEIPGQVPLLGGLPTLSLTGIELGVLYSAKLLAVVLVSVYFNTTTSSSEFLVAAESMRIPHAFALMVNIVLRFIPRMMDDMGKIMEAQQARGLELSRRNYRKRMRNLVHIVKPVVLSYLLKARRLAMSMEARGFRVGGERSRLVELRMSAGDYAAIAITVVFAALCLIPGALPV